MGEQRVTVRLPQPYVELLDRVAEDRCGGNRSQAIRFALDRAQPSLSAPQERLDEDALVELLEERARAGSTAAVSKLLAIREQQRARAELDRLRELTT
jgi:Arc/MetJ-type ribon-helix-helix transcriptional regulator